MSTSEPDPNQCLACRGTGTLSSGLGGTPHEVRCPWCEGTGTRIPGIDAQAHPSEDGPSLRPAPAAADEAGDADDAAPAADAT